MEDEDCDVYVILISYFVQNADATVKEVYYEGEQFPEYVKVPGIVHADKVIVQSEKMREIYIDALTEFVGEDTKAVWEEKIKGSGISIDLDV